jgi:CheY-like chemotaxis protein
MTQGEMGNILIADDEETFLLSTADLLRREGYHCDCAPDAPTAARMLGDGDYDLLIADIKMPGNEDLKLIRDLPSLTEGLPVILVTGYPSLKTAMESFRLPVAAYLPNPVEWQDLLTGVQEGVRRYRFFRMVRKVRSRLQRWEEDLKQIEGAPPDPRHPGSWTTMDSFFNLTFQNLIDSLWDVKNLAQSLSGGRASQEVCHLLTCPRLALLKESLSETIDVLEKTKTAFKSKELADLRKKLEGLRNTLS